MTTALEQLRQDVAAQREAAERAQAELTKRNRAEALEYFRNQVLAQPVPAGIFDELKAEFKFKTSAARPVVIFHYRGTTMEEGYSSSVTAETIAKWTNQIDRQIADHERKRADAHDRLTNSIPQAESFRALSRLRTDAENLQFDDLTEALDARQAELQAARDAEIDQVVAQVEAATDRNTLERIEWDYAGELRVTTAIGAARERLHQAAAEREERRLQAEQEAFYPFSIWRLRYGIIATSENGDSYADIDSIYTTAPIPNSASFYTRCPDAQDVYIYNPVLAERVDVTTVKQMNQTTSRRIHTEYGWINVPPANCQAL